MRRGIIGVTVGTPISPKAIERKIKPVKTVNGVKPDENGNVDVAGNDGFSPVAKVTQTDTGAVISITDKKGTTTATVANGKDGAQGIQGIQGVPGEKGDKGDAGDDGVYVLADGETIEDAPEYAKIIINPNEEAPAYVQTVNGIAPDKNGNVVVSGGSGGGAQSDWNAKEGEPGHVLNRTHWVENANVTILEDTTLVADEDNPGLFLTEADITLEVGKTYTVFYNGTEYACVAVDGATITEEYTGMAIIGNFAAVMGTGNTGEPFAAAIAPGYAIQIMDLQSATACTIAIHYSGELVHKLDEKYIPDTIARVSDIFGAMEASY